MNLSCKMDNGKLLETLQKNGIAIHGSLAYEDTVQIRAWFKDRTVYNAHVRAKSTASCLQHEAVAKRAWPMFCTDMKDVVLAPHLFELMLSYYDFAKAYFDGEQPYLYSMNAFWTQPAPGPQYQDTHGWHRDGDDRKQLVVFVLGTDVVHVSDGAHMYQAGTHKLKDDSLLGRDFRNPPHNIIKTVVGAAGTVFLADTGGLHMGLRPAQNARMLAWGRWGVTCPPQSYKWDQLSPVSKDLLGSRYPADEGLQRAVHLVAE